MLAASGAGQGHPRHRAMIHGRRTGCPACGSGAAGIGCPAWGAATEGLACAAGMSAAASFSAGFLGLAVLSGGFFAVVVVGVGMLVPGIFE